MPAVTSTDRAEVLATYYHLRRTSGATPYAIMDTIRTNAANIIARSYAERGIALPVFVARWAAADQYIDRMIDQGGYWFRPPWRRA